MTGVPQQGTVTLAKAPWLIVNRVDGVPTHVRSALTGQPVAVRVELNIRAAYVTNAPRVPLVWRHRR